MKRILNPLFAAVFAVTSLSLTAQDSPEGHRPGGHRGAPPIVSALDTNQDGTIDATEIANASAALLALDKNGDGQLTPDELMPKRPEGQGGPGGPGGRRGQRPAPPTE